MLTENNKANDLITLLEQFVNTKINGLTEFSLRCIEDQDVEHCSYRAGFTERVGAFEDGYSHFYIFLECCLIYFSKNNIYIRYVDEESTYREIYRGDINEFLQVYFQLSIQYDLLSKDFFLRVKNFMSSYNWVKHS